MRTYWDFAEAQRAAMSRDDVAKFIDAELMLKSVLQVPPLTLVDESAPALPTEPYYRIGGQYDGLDIAFRSEADVRAFLALGAQRIASEWATGSENRYVEPIVDTPIQLVQLPTKAQVQGSAVALKEVQAAKSENERRRRDHVEATKKIDDALKGLWDDWHECVAKAQRVQHVADTFAKYLGLCDGDRKVASRFFAQTFSAASIREAIAWGAVPEDVMAPLAAAPEAAS